ncbi:unnamed protein product, partial [Vitrella brassicaformis CCMP3155]
MAPQAAICKFHQLPSGYRNDRCAFRHVKICQFNAVGACTRDPCPFLHDTSIVCNFFLNNRCTRGHKCGFLHPQLPTASGARRPPPPPPSPLGNGHDGSASNAAPAPLRPRQARPPPPQPIVPPEVAKLERCQDNCKPQLGARLAAVQQDVENELRKEEQIDDDPDYNTDKVDKTIEALLDEQKALQEAQQQVDIEAQEIKQLLPFQSDMHKMEFSRRLKCLDFRTTADNRLPIYSKRSVLLEAIERHPVVIVTAQTGSGKSTQIIQYVSESAERFGLTPGTKMVVCTQPRKIAASMLAKRVGDEYGSPQSITVPKFPGCRVTSGRPPIAHFTTDSSLVNYCLANKNLDDYGVVIIDEAHERSLSTDLLIGLVKLA